ncbi:MAG: hydrogenase iron-sulfur subunit, partial [Desulfobacteraceae bacterium]|nr:hydrogenase iron-sulfur subunit [Desulfobacteraceae bacterium]
YSAADLAGSMRLSYPSNVRIVKVPCTGRVDAVHLLKAVEMGADGVFVAGCLEGECHYRQGNLRAKKRVEYVRGILKSIGIEPERVVMVNLSAGQGPQFAEMAREVTETVRKLGPSPLRPGETGKEVAA